MYLRNIQQWHSMFWEGRTDSHNEHEGLLSMMLDKAMQCVHFLLNDNHCFTITDMQREMAKHFSHKAGGATIVHALQQLNMQKVCEGCVNTHGRTSKILHETGTQHPYSICEGWKWLASNSFHKSIQSLIKFLWFFINFSQILLKFFSIFSVKSSNC